MQAEAPQGFRATVSGRGDALVERTFQWFAGSAVAVFLLLLVYFAWVHFSSIPYLDSWSAYIGFYMDADTAQAWWRQHNQHRILFSKLYFWLDLHFFAGRAVILVVLNFLLLGLAWAVLAASARELLRGYSKAALWLICCTLALICASWMQHDNLASPFQNQFIAAFAFPLLAFFLLAHAEQQRGAFAAALAIGSVAQYSMISGVFCLPLMTLYCLLRWGSGRRFQACLVLTVVLCWLYFVGFEPGKDTAQGVAILSARPGYFVQYIACYLGAPLARAMGGGADLSIALGYAAVVLFVHLLVRCLRGDRAPHRLALLAFVGYVMISAALTSLGRSVLGYDSAMVSRYATPTLLMWTALLLLVLPASFGNRPWAPRFIFLGVLLLLLQQQSKCLLIDHWALPDKVRQAALLGYQLGAGTPALQLLGAGESEALVRRAQAARVSIFDDSRTDMSALAALLGRDMSTLPGTVCQLAQVNTEAWSERNGVMRVGAILPELSAGRFEQIALGDAQGRVVGVGVIDHRPPLNLDNGPERVLRGFLVRSPTFSSAKCLDTF
jgi:hypothetical protein